MQNMNNHIFYIFRQCCGSGFICFDLDLDLDPLVRDLAPDPSIIEQN
jgi:hypothetical protein